MRRFQVRKNKNTNNFIKEFLFLHLNKSQINKEKMNIVGSWEPHAEESCNPGAGN